MSPDSTAPAGEMKMTPEDFAALRADVARIGLSDVQLGRVLSALLLHLGHAHGLDPAVEDARLAAKARQDARAAEDARLKDEAEARASLRTAEDAQPRTSAEKETLLVRRAAEDLQLKADAEKLAKQREEEDARLKAAEAPESGAVAPETPALPEGETHAH